jgi:hypothetical protein
MQVLGRVAMALARPAGTRSVGGYTSNAAKLMGKTHGSGTADKIGLMVMLPLSAAFVAYDLLYPEEEFEGKIPEYPYLKIRTRTKYPWGSDYGPFEVHRFIGDDDRHH